LSQGTCSTSGMHINAVANSVVLQLQWVHACVKNKWNNSIAYRGDSII